jgi:hypothetical protein
MGSAVRVAVLVSLTATLGVALFGVALLGATTASAATPAAYRAQVNRICRGYTPTGKKIETAMKDALAKKDYQAYGVVLGELLILNLSQDRKIEAVPVPPPLKPQLAPIIARLKKIDAHTQLALLRARQSDSTGLATELTTIGTLAKPLNAQLDKAGLRDCGSNQS